MASLSTPIDEDVTIADHAAPTPLTGDGAAQRGEVAAPRLARHVIHLDDGHRVGVAVAGRGVPLVVVHGYSAEGFLYAQTLSRLVSMGFKVVTIDVAGHGGTASLAQQGRTMRHYAELLGRAVDALGIERAVFAGHSMGGRLVAELVARQPERGVALLLVDAIVGDTWDAMVNLFRVAPPLLGLTGAALAVDTATTLPLVANPRQALKLTRLVTPTLVSNALRPWQLVSPAMSILFSGPSRWILEQLGQQLVPVFVLHGERDIAVPLRTAVDASRRSRGTLVVVKGASHSWLLKDPETLPAVVGRLLEGRLGQAYRDAVAEAGLDPETATIADMEGALYEPGALILQLTPELAFTRTGTRRRRALYAFDVHDPVPGVAPA